MGQRPWGRPHAALVQWSWGPPLLAPILCATTGEHPASGGGVLLRSWYHTLLSKNGGYQGAWSGLRTVACARRTQETVCRLALNRSAREIPPTKPLR